MGACKESRFSLLITGFKDVFGWVMIVIIEACLLNASFTEDVG